jgi:hypothetical protein
MEEGFSSQTQFKREGAVNLLMLLIWLVKVHVNGLRGVEVKWRSDALGKVGLQFFEQPGGFRRGL